MFATRGTVEIDTDDLAAAIADTARSVAALAFNQRLALVGPCIEMPDIGGSVWGRHVAFADSHDSAATAFISLSATRPPAAIDRLMIDELRNAFKIVRTFGTAEQMARVAATTWPCAETSKFAAQFDYGAS